ncbi:tetratricopeptide repeat protein [Flavobacterium jejuense]|uniref:Tetratricopeptide repeat protein n=1 Tax=Flavobacterium jejuense TaxID=1544455 RepID=A0ABX0IUE2_9FLAO|nr:tetratricopeptide repeat protein [Flavobacterium jejuense]NHN27524.1 tetratricopeptide repeat protein [Flavobacterium jejuense]
MISRFILLLLFTTSLFAQNEPVSHQLQNIKEALELEIKKENKQGIAVKMLELGEVYNNYGLYANALVYYNDALKITQNKQKDTLYVLINNAIGSVNKTMYKYKIAETFFSEALVVSKEIKYAKGQAKALSLLGANAEKQSKYKEALQFENESLLFFNPVKDSLEIAIVYENIGSIYEDLLDFDKAFLFFEKALAILKNANSKEKASVLNNIGDVYRKKRFIEKGIDFTKQSLEIATKISDNHLLESANKDLAKAYALLGKYEKAYQYKLIAEEYKQVSIANENKNLVNLLQADFKINQKENQIKLLQEQHKTNMANQNLVIVLSASSLVITFIVFSYYRKKRKASIKIQNYKQQALKIELEKKEIEEKNLQRDLELKTATLSRYSLHIAQKNKMLSELSLKLKNIVARKNDLFEVKIKEVFNEIDFALQQENEWGEFAVFFEEIHPNFIKKLSKIATENLSPAELKLGILLRLNLSSKEIASILRVTPDSVRVARHRFRKKLPIDSKKELVAFLLEL